MTRLPPIPRAQWTPEFVAALQEFDPPTVRLPRMKRELKPTAWAPMEAFAHNPDLTRAFLSFNGHVLWGTTLTARWRHTIILRVAARRRAAFLWGEHHGQGVDAGLTDEEIWLLADPVPDVSDPIEAALVRAVDELVDDGAVSSRTWGSLATELDNAQLLDVVFTAGCYQTVAGFMRSVELEVDPSMPPLPSQEDHR